MAAVVGEGMAGAEEIARGENRERRVEVLQVAVVADVESGARVEEIGDEEIVVHVFGGLDGSARAVGEGGVVLGNEAQGKRAGELVVPLGADDVVVENGFVGADRAEAREDVAVINGELLDGVEREPEVGELIARGDRRAWRHLAVARAQPARRKKATLRLPRISCHHAPQPPQGRWALRHAFQVESAYSI